MTSKYPWGRRHPTGCVILGKPKPSIWEKMREESLHQNQRFPFFFFLQNRQHFPQEKHNKRICGIQHSTLFLTSGTVCTGKISCYYTDFGSRSWQGSWEAPLVNPRKTRYIIYLQPEMLNPTVTGATSAPSRSKLRFFLPTLLSEMPGKG